MMRASSSYKSTSCLLSLLNEGTLTLRLPEPDDDTWHEMPASVARIAGSLIEVPNQRLRRDGAIVITVRFSCLLPASRRMSSFQPAMLQISEDARAEARSTPSGSTPLSKR